MMKRHDLAVLTHDVPERGLVEGDVGAVVRINDREPAYEVEFVTGSGHKIDVLTLTDDDLRPVGAREILHVRSAVT